jgi:hypothetical protein
MQRNAEIGLFSKPSEFWLTSSSNPEQSRAVMLETRRGVISRGLWRALLDRTQDTQGEENG